ncbi:MAG: carboxypeptidase regulatory-like domain-containing protein [Gemmatimonadales bacterium]|nr:carboxypeptidase regulatory-like domain-containing protein [Gemmatimonadales bacterium]
MHPTLHRIVTVACAILVCNIALGPAGPVASHAADSVPSDDKGSTHWKERIWVDFPIRIELDSVLALDQLLLAAPIASFNREQVGFRTGKNGARILVFQPRVTEQEAEILLAEGYGFIRLPDLEKSGRRAVEAEWARRSSGGTEREAPEKSTQVILDYYPTYTEMVEIMDQLALDYPAICRTFIWGTSVEGLLLNGLVISADVQNSAPEPEVRLSSTMHGDEPIGTILLLNLADYLTVNYGQTGFEEITDLVDNTEIHIMPLHNPDGYGAGTRSNASGVDLNRNFPEPAGSHLITEIENIAFMDYGNAHHFVISENAHSGALVVNYPWDYTYDLTPDDLAFIQLSLEYSTYNLPMYNGSFPQGITNGADWYIATGTGQDWAYHVTGCMDVTVELSNQKWPNASQLPDLWDNNRESLLHFIRASRYGVNGVVTESVTGQPLAATITVTGNDKSVITDPEHGDYYKLLDEGVYDVTVTAEGYVPRIFTDVNVSWGAATVMDVALDPDSSSTDFPRPLVASVEAWPNPFNGGTSVHFTNSDPGLVTVGIYDLQGRLVRLLASGEMQVDQYVEHWDGRDDKGVAVGSGVYFARMVAGAREASAKLVLIK